MSRARLTAAFAAGMLPFLCGCPGETGPEIVEVEGTVTINGEPANKMRVELWPDQTYGTKSAGNTDEQGHFVLMTWDQTQKGAVVGRHKVVVRDNDLMKVPFAGRANENVDTSQGAKPRHADKYTNFMSTPIEIEITGPKKDLVIDVEPYQGGGGGAAP